MSGWLDGSPGDPFLRAPVLCSASKDVDEEEDFDDDEQEEEKEEERGGGDDEDEEKGFWVDGLIETMEKLHPWIRTLGPSPL